jgi:hypothetical protein
VSGHSVFVDQHTLLVTFERRVPGKMASRDQLEETSPLRLQGVFFETDSGRVVAQRDWGIFSAGAYVLTGHNGKFVLCLGRKLALYSLAMEPLKELELPPSHNESRVDFWGTYPSPSGRTLLLIHRQGNQFDYQVIDGETLSSLESWSARGWPSTVVADDKLAVMRLREIPDSSPSTKKLVGDDYKEPRSFAEGGVAVRRLGGTWTVVCEGSRCGSPWFVNNDVLSLDRGDELRFIRTDGQPLSPRFRIGQSGSGRQDALTAGVFRASAQGDRFAVPLFSPRPEMGDSGGRSSLSNLVRILVFDLPSGQWIGALEASQYKIERICYPALSPDGSLLALFRQEGIVEVYPLPASPAAPQGK